MPATKPEFYTPKEILAAENNALLAIRREKTIATLDEARIRYLRAFAEALEKPFAEFVEEKAITGIELVFVLQGVALKTLLLHAYPQGLPAGAYKMLQGE